MLFIVLFCSELLFFVQLAQQDTNLMSEFERKRQEAKERSRLAREKGNNFSKLMAFKKRLAGGPGGAPSSAAVVAVLPDAKNSKTAKVSR